MVTGTSLQLQEVSEGGMGGSGRERWGRDAQISKQTSVKRDENH